MNIGLSTSVIQRGRSGVAQYVFALVRALRPWAARHHFTLFVLEQDLPLFEFARDVMELVPVAETHRPPVWDIFWHQMTLPGLAAQHRLDVLHVPSYRRMLRTARCALVATIHDLAPFHLAGKYDWARTFYGRVVARQLAHRQDRIIAVSRTTARDLARFFALPVRKVDVIHNGLDHARFQPGPATEARAWVAATQGVSRPFFLYVSRLEHPGKNHVRLIEAFNRFKAASGSDWQLVFGGSDWHGAEVIHDAIRRSRHAADIRCIGFVPDADLPQWYQAAGALVYPSLFEGFGLPPLEAMACGCPVVSSNRGALAEVAGPAAALFDPEDVAGMQQLLGRLAADEGWRDSLRVAGLRHAQGFAWATTAGATMETYRRAAEMGSSIVRRGAGAPS